MIKRITSAENAKVKAFRRLYIRKNRDRDKLFIIEGPTLIKEAVSSGIQLETVFIREGYEFALCVDGDVKSICKNIYELPETLFDHIIETNTPQGAAATARIPYTESDVFYDLCNSIVILDRIQDPGNIGTILRTAEAAGFDGIIAMRGTADLFSPKTVRAAAGSLYRINIIYESEPEKVLKDLKHYDISSFCTSPRAEIKYFDADLRGNIALIVGNEANGACDVFMNKADMNITLPMQGCNESLNAAVSAAIVMYESLRQNIKKL